MSLFDYPTRDEIKRILIKLKSPSPMIVEHVEDEGLRFLVTFTYREKNAQRRFLRSWFVDYSVNKDKEKVIKAELNRASRKLKWKKGLQP